MLIELNPHAAKLIYLTPVPASKMQLLYTYIRGLIFELGRDFPSVTFS